MTETGTRTSIRSAIALGILLLAAGGIFASAVLIKTKRVEVRNTPQTVTAKHGLKPEQWKAKLEEEHAKLAALTSAGNEQQPATQATDDCKAQMNQADFTALAALNRDVTCAGTTAPTVQLTQNITLTPAQTFRIFLGSVDTDGVTTHSVNFDCQGHSIAHSGYTFTLYYSSILRNCTILRPTRGVWALNTSQVINTTVKNPYETGFVADQRARISDSTALADMSPYEIVGNGFSLLGESQTTNSQATSIVNQATLYWGFEVSARAIATNATATQNRYGFSLDSGAVVNSGRAINNTSDGFLMAPGPMQPAWFGIAPTCTSCVAENNGGNGFQAYGRIGSPSDQAISTIQGGIAKGNAWNGFLLFNGSKAVSSKAENNGTNVTDINGGFWSEDQAHFGFRLDDPENLQSVAQVVDSTGSGNKNGILLGSIFSLQNGTYCSNAGQDIVLRTGGTMSGNIKADKIQNSGGTNTATQSGCATNGTPGKQPLHIQ